MLQAYADYFVRPFLQDKSQQAITMGIYCVVIQSFRACIHIPSKLFCAGVYKLNISTLVISDIRPFQQYGTVIGIATGATNSCKNTCI